MADVVPICNQNGVPEARRVLSLFGKTYRGFLLTKDFEAGPSGPSPRYWAYYTDGQIERIDPPNGNPRPKPDPAVRTKGLKLPSSLQLAPQVPYTPASRYSGLMRQVVQCEFIRGSETKFSYGWQKTHGILEWPQPRKIGNTPADELKNIAQRKFWIIEISNQGVFVAPVSIEKDCLKCANVDDYTPTAQQLQQHPEWSGFKNDLSLAWAYENRNGGEKIKRLIDNLAMQAVYTAGSPWTSTIGWAFNRYGTAASNVIAKGEADGYHTFVYDIAFTITFQATSCSVYTIGGGVAEVSKVNHGFAVGDLAVISGANEAEYNGVHVVDTVPDVNHLRFSIQGNPGSPATGDVKLANGKNDATLGATVSNPTSGRVSFTFQSSLWVPSSNPTVWDAVAPIFNVDNKSGPVFVYYDGEEKKVFNWSLERIVAPADVTPPVNGVPWNGHQSGHHWYAGATQSLSACQYAYGFEYQEWVKYSGGHNYGPYTQDTLGFSDALTTLHLTKNESTSTTSAGGGFTLYGEYGNQYSLPESCYFICGDPPQLITACGAYFKQSLSGTYLTRTDVSNNISRGGSSFGIIMPLERECFATVHTQSVAQSIQTQTFSTWEGTHFKEEKLPDTRPCTCPATTIDLEMRTNINTTYAGSPPPPPPPTSSESSSVSVSGLFQFHATQGFSVSVGLTFGAAPFYSVMTEDIADFTIFNANKNTAQSGLYYMRGGMNHNNPYLTPVDQKGNNVHKLTDAAFQTAGGFASVQGKQIIGFVGLV